MYLICRIGGVYLYGIFSVTYGIYKHYSIDDCFTILSVTISTPPLPKKWGLFLVSVTLIVVFGERFESLSFINICSRCSRSYNYPPYFPEFLAFLSYLG